MNTPIRRLEINDKTLDFFSENVRKCVNNNVDVIDFLFLSHAMLILFYFI